MPEAPFKLQPQTGYVLTASPDFGGINQEWLVDYYQPLLNPVATNLLLILVNQLLPNPTVTERRQHTGLLDQLGAGINQVDQARVQLEAVGLLRTFFKVDQLGPVVIYQLQPLKSPAAFLKEDLLAVVLLQHVGQTRYQALVKKANRYYMATTDYHEITKGFFDIFKTMTTPADQQLVTTSQTQLGQPSPQKKSENIPTLDWTFLAGQVQAQGLDASELSKHRQLILTEKRVYGLSELDLVSSLLSATDLTTGKLDEEQFKLVVANQARPQEVQEVSGIETPPAQEQKKALNQQEQALADEANQGSPLQYLTDLKKATGSGFVSSAERKTLERLVSQTPLTDGAINILSYYVLVDQGNANLAANFVNAIANNWTRQGVRTASDAVLAIQRFWQKGNAQTKLVNKRGRRGAIVEKLPDWAKDDRKRQHQGVSSDQIQAGKEALAKLRAAQKKTTPPK